MKKLLILLSGIMNLTTFSQVSFEKKASVIDFNANFGIYNTVASDSSLRANGKTKEDKAAPYGFSLAYEYGVLDWLGIGLRGQSTTYLNSKDSATGVTPVTKSKDIMMVVNAHFLRKKRMDMLVGFNLGYSAFKFTTNDTKHAIAKGGGVAYDIHLQPRLYFTDNFGMYFNLSYTGFSYNNLMVSDDDRKYTDHFKISASGMNVGLGLQFKF